MVRLGVTNSRLAPNKLTPLRSEGVVRQGNRQAGRQLAAACRQTVRGQVHWVQQAEAWLHPGYLLSPRLELFQKHLVKPRPGEWTVLVKAGMAETGAAI